MLITIFAKASLAGICSATCTSHDVEGDELHVLEFMQPIVAFGDQNVMLLRQSIGSVRGCLT